MASYEEQAFLPMPLGKSETLWLPPKWMSSDVIREAGKVRSISEVALWCYNGTQTSFAQLTVFFYLFIIKARNSRTLLNLLSSYLCDRSHRISCAGNCF